MKRDVPEAPMNEALALWYVRREEVEIRPTILADLCSNEARIKTLWSGISRGTSSAPATIPSARNSVRSATSAAVCDASTAGAQATSSNRSTAAEAQNSALPSIAKRARAVSNRMRIFAMKTRMPDSAVERAGGRRGRSNVATADTP